MRPVPRWLAAVGLAGNSAVAAVLLEREQSVWLLFLGLAIISYFTTLRGGRDTDPSTPERHTP